MRAQSRLLEFYQMRFSVGKSTRKNARILSDAEWLHAALGALLFINTPHSIFLSAHNFNEGTYLSVPFFPAQTGGRHFTRQAVMQL